MGKLKAQFLTPLQVEQVTEDDWRLLSPLRFYSRKLDRVLEIPAGFITDFASVPRWPFIYWFTGGTASAPAVLHDWFYRTNTEDITRAASDAVLKEAMEARGYWYARTWMMYLGVRIGGYWSYDKRRANVSVHSTGPTHPVPEVKLPSPGQAHQEVQS